MNLVLLAKPNRLTAYLANRLGETGCLKGVVWEEGRSSWQSFLNVAKREGAARAVDVIAYQLWAKVGRRGQFARELDRFVPAPAYQQVACKSIDVGSVNDSGAREFIERLAPDMILVHATGLINRDIYEIPAWCSVNLHCGYLPLFRGHDSTFWAMAAEAPVGVTLHRVVRRADAGEIFSRAEISLEPGDSDITAWLKAFRSGVDQACKLVLRARDRGFPELTGQQDSTHKAYSYRGLSDYLALDRKRSQ